MRHDLGSDDLSKPSFVCADFCQKTEVVGAVSHDSIFICSVATGELLRRFSGELDYIESITFSPIRNLLVIAGDRRRHLIVKIWNWTSGEVLKTIHTHDCSLVRFSPDGRLFTFGPKPVGPTTALFPYNSVKVWDATTGQQVAVFNNGTSSRRCAVFSENKQWLVFRQDTVRLWDLASQVEHSQHEEPDSIPISCVYLSPDHTMAVTFEGKIGLWDLKTCTLRHNAGNESLGWVFFSPDSKRSVNSTYGKNAVKDMSTGEIILDLGDSSGSCYAFSKDGTILARPIFGNGSRVQILGVDSQGLLRTLEVPGDDPMSLKTTLCLAFSPSGRFLAAATRTTPHIPDELEEVRSESDKCVRESPSLDISIWG
ncbi:hypothetical protein N7488_002273 [Penicillium malachiteum]|nr:hypothetical protein N7488_002273 [Penicillium malachiteum]